MPGFRSPIRFLTFFHIIEVFLAGAPEKINEILTDNNY